MATNSFHLQRTIPNWGKQTFVNWCVNDVDKAVIFIHGFNGSSENTFGDFHLEFRFREEFADKDVYFFSYDSLFVQIPNSGLRFKKFLEIISTNLGEVVSNSHADISRTSNYKKVTIIAHSLGAVVARWALMRAYNQNCNWVHNIELILFAPAENGAREEILDFLCFPGYLKMLGPAIKYFVTTVKQLTNKSLIVEPLKKEYIALCEKSNPKFAFAKGIIWAQKERVVTNDIYLKDEPDPIEFDTDHVSICKPTKKFSYPFEIVADILKTGAYVPKQKSI
jgi:hypothetical protein